MWEGLCLCCSAIIDHRLTRPPTGAMPGLLTSNPTSADREPGFTLLIKMPGFWTGPLEMLRKRREMQMRLCSSLQHCSFPVSCPHFPHVQCSDPSGPRSPMRLSYPWCSVVYLSGLIFLRKQPQNLFFIPRYAIPHPIHGTYCFFSLSRTFLVIP